MLYDAHLYHVVDGIDLFSPKFNRVPPAVNEQMFFPYSQLEDREPGDRTRVHDWLFKRSHAHILGHLDDPSKRPILAVAPINAIKNLTGLAECFCSNQELLARCNLIILTNALDLIDTINPDEVREIEKLHAIVDQYQLHGHIRWLGIRLPTRDLGEAYRAIADRQGIFVHFARFEAFGRTILEAMISGLPTFATQFGGSLEIIQDSENGFHINPTNLDGTAQKILHFLDQCDANPQHWHNISDRAIKRIREQYNWQLNTRQLLLLAKIYSFWNYVCRDSREALLRYLEALFHLIYKPRAEQILAEHMRR